MILLRDKIRSLPKWTLLIAALFTLSIGFSGFAHNHAPGMESPDCPAYFIQYYFNAEAAITFILTLLLLFLSLLPVLPERIATKTLAFCLSTRAPPFSF